MINLHPFNRFKSVTKTTIILLFLFGLVSKQAYAESSKSLPKFQVEVVVFETYALKGWTEEFWPLELPFLDTDSAQALRPLPESDYLLNDAVAKMTHEMGYNVIYHRAWIVDAESKENAKPILIYRSGDEPGSDSRLEGTITFWKSRFPHVKVDLELEREIPERIKEKFAQHEQMDPELLPEFWRFQIKESRKLKTGQLHYLDHPIFGALVQIKWRPELSR